MSVRSQVNMQEFEERDVMLVLSRVYHLAVESLEGHVGIPVPRWRLLFLLHVHGQCTQKDLTKMINIDPGSITRSLKTLESHKLVARESDPTDNRLTRVMLTPLGLRAARAGMKRRRQFLMDMLGGLSRNDIASLFQSLSHIEKNFQTSTALTK
jgi:DNA-binding MarR family transcriptional regulator